MRLRRAAVPAAGFAMCVMAVLAGCGVGPTKPTDGKLHLVAGFYPLQFVAEQVGGDRVAVTNLVQPGAEAHDLELSPRQIVSIVDADLVLHLRGFQPAIDDAVRLEAADSSFDVASVVPLLKPTTELGPRVLVEPDAEPERLAGGVDPHVWLDPIRLATVADSLAERLAAADAANAAGFRDRARALRARLTDLDRRYTDGLQSCQRREFVVSHGAFSYLADRYRLNQISITGLSPESEPTPQRLATVAALARKFGATTIFFETLVSPKVAEAIANETGAKTAVLDPIEGLPAGSTDNYLSMMQHNLTALTTALGCA